VRGAPASRRPPARATNSTNQTNPFQQMDKQTMGTFDDSNYSNPQYSIFGGLQFPPTSPLSTLAAAQYRPTPGATIPNPAAAAPGPLAIPPAQPPIFLSPPDPSNAAPAPPPNPLGSLGNAITNGISNYALTLMALGAGIAQGGVGRGLTDAATAAAAERNRQLQQLNFLSTYKALTDGGVPPQEAQAAIGNRASCVRWLRNISDRGPLAMQRALRPPRRALRLCRRTSRTAPPMARARHPQAPRIVRVRISRAMQQT